MVCLGNRDHSVVSEISSKHCILDFCLLWWLLHFFQGILPTIVDIIVIWVNPFQSILVRWFLKCRRSLLPSHLTTSDLPWFMDLTFQVRMQYCSLQHWTLLPSPVTSTTGCCFCFGSISSFFLSLGFEKGLIHFLVPGGIKAGGSGISVFSVFLFLTLLPVLEVDFDEWFSLHTLLLKFFSHQYFDNLLQLHLQNQCLITNWNSFFPFAILSRWVCHLFAGFLLFFSLLTINKVITCWMTDV